MEHRRQKLEPGGGSIAAIFVAEMRFEDASFGAGAGDLEDQHGHNKQEQVGAFEKKKEPGEHKGAEDIDGIANARVDAGGDELRGLGPQ